MSRLIKVVLICLGTIVFLLIFISFEPVVITHATALTNQVESTPDPLSIKDDTCLSCHGQPGLTLALENGEILELYVNPQDHQNSIHGLLGYACVQCHRTVGDYPHPTFFAKDLRDASLQLYEACKTCHLSQYNLTQDSVHGAAFARGTREAAICTDCHTAHAVRQLKGPDGELLPETRTWIPTTCAKCHNAIYEKYKESVHGSALIGEGNPDVPTCIDCHGVHNIEDPTTLKFRLRSPEICSKCHTDPNIMTRYGLSTQVLSTYVADFHGTTVTLFSKLTPDAKTNTPVCYDCHGIHDIKRVNDPQAGIHIKENLLVRCRECHPDATINFPDSWLSHYTPSAENATVVYYVNLFYKVFIPVVLGSMLILVLLDVSSRVRRRYLRTERAVVVDSKASNIREPVEQTSLPVSDPEDQESSNNIGVGEE